MRLVLSLYSGKKLPTVYSPLGKVSTPMKISFMEMEPVSETVNLNYFKLLMTQWIIFNHHMILMMLPTKLSLFYIHQLLSSLSYSLHKVQLALYHTSVLLNS